MKSCFREHPPNSSHVGEWDPEFRRLLKAGGVLPTQPQLCSDNRHLRKFSLPVQCLSAQFTAEGQLSGGSGRALSPKKGTKIAIRSSDWQHASRIRLSESSLASCVMTVRSSSIAPSAKKKHNPKKCLTLTETPNRCLNYARDKLPVTDVRQRQMRCSSGLLGLVLSAQVSAQGR